MDVFAVIDTETNWNNELMSVGAVLADGDTMAMLDKKYYVLAPEFTVGGIFGPSLFLPGFEDNPVTTRGQMVLDLTAFLKEAGAEHIFAYNAMFDRRLLPELAGFHWYDIMRLAAYRQYNDRIPPQAECCSTGRLRRDYGVEPMLRLLSGSSRYCETHNALIDAMDELRIMQLLGHKPEKYIEL
ncbi:MAG: hypothetical protein II794_03835 [Oscillospiraceae bacterium]|nr:hypothetical protein [Oscillospiraceae bacterium]